MPTKRPANDTLDPTPDAWTAPADLLRVVAHPVRLRILAALSRRSYCVKDLNALAPDVPQPVLSQHMGALRRIGLVASHTDGPLRCYYILRPSLVARLVDLLGAEHPEQPRDRADVQREARSPLTPPANPQGER